MVMVKTLVLSIGNVTGVLGLCPLIPLPKDQTGILTLALTLTQRPLYENSHYYPSH